MTMKEKLTNIGGNASPRYRVLDTAATYGCGVIKSLLGFESSCIIAVSKALKYSDPEQFKEATSTIGKLPISDTTEFTLIPNFRSVMHFVTWERAIHDDEFADALASSHGETLTVQYPVICPNSGSRKWVKRGNNKWYPDILMNIRANIINGTIPDFNMFNREENTLWYEGVPTVPENFEEIFKEFTENLYD